MDDEPKASKPNIASSPRKAHLSHQHIPSEMFSSPANISWPIIVLIPREVHTSSQQIRSVMFGFPVKISWPNIASLHRKVPPRSQQVPSEVRDFPTAFAFSRHWGGVFCPTPPAIYVPGNTIISIVRCK